MEYNGYCVRVQALDGYAEKIRMLPATTDYQSIAAIDHKGKTGENAHYHFVIKTDVKDQAFRVRMKKVFNLGKGNEHMSIKTWDGALEAISYLFHEEPDGALMLQHNISDETVAKARELNKTIQTKVATAKERASWKIEEEIYQYLLSQPNLPRDEYNISKQIILFALRHDKYVPNDFLLKAMTYKIQFRLMDGDLNDEEKFAKQYVARVFRMDQDQEHLWMNGPPGGGGRSKSQIIQIIQPPIE